MTPARLTARHGALLVVDLQERLLAVIPDRQAVLDNVIRLVQGARLLALPVAATEQYPRGLGPTAAELLDLLPDRAAKTTFHACDAPGFLESLHAQGVRHVTVVGVEAHVCVAQTALELLSRGFLVQVPADAVASRHASDRDFALRRLERAGAVVSTSEAVLFEWAESADHPQFKALSALVKARDSAANLKAHFQGTPS